MQHDNLCAHRHFCHELRTPLTIASGVAEILEKTQNDLNTEQRQLIAMLNTSTAQLRKLITESITATEPTPHV